MMFEHLILLIGTNPLPNFVVAEHFLHGNTDLKDIYLVYSEEKGNQKGTLSETKNLQKLLSERHKNLQLYTIPLSDVSSAVEIDRDIRGQLLSRLPSDCKIHFNYTGGTKAMSIHIYRAIEMESQKIIEKSFSYLDARHFLIIDDNKGVINNDLRQDIWMEFKELIDIHGFHRIKDNSKTHDFSQTLAEFCGLIEEGRLHEYFKSYNRKKYLKKDKLINKKTEITEELREHKANGVFLEIVSSSPEGYQLFNREGKFTEPLTNNHLKSIVKFIDGLWLEEYVFQSLEKEFEGSKVSIDKNWKIKKSEWTTDFELDVVLMNGYQLIGMSCTTSDMKSVCKSKGFEIIHRTQQIGGSEAKAVIITRLEHDKKIDLQDELGIHTGGKTNILVLGIEDLKKTRLIREINDFISN